MTEPWPDAKDRFGVTILWQPRGWDRDELRHSVTVWIVAQEADDVAFSHIAEGMTSPVHHLDPVSFRRSYEPVP